MNLEKSIRLLIGFFYEITGVLDRNESQNIQKLAAKESNVFTTLFNKSLSFRSTIRSILHSIETNSNLPPRYIKETNEILKIMRDTMY